MTDSALTAAAEALVFRACERVGNRTAQHTDGRRRLHGMHQATATSVPPAYERHITYPVPASDCDGLLAGAWTLVPVIAQAHGVDPVVLESTLDGFTRHLLTAGHRLDEVERAELGRALRILR